MTALEPRVREWLLDFPTEAVAPSLTPRTNGKG